MRGSSWIALSVFAALLALGACATVTPYAPAASPRAFGYSEAPIEANRVRVTFRGNSLTDRETVENYLLYRAAELTLARGMDYFVIVDRDTDAHRRVEYMGSPFYPAFRPHWTYFSRRHGWGLWSDPFWDDPNNYREITHYEASAEIALFSGPKPADDPKAFDARDVQRNLQGRIVRPTPG